MRVRQRLAEVFSQRTEAAREQKRSALAVAGAIQAVAGLGSAQILNSYTDALGIIRREGVPQYLARISPPYVDATSRHLDPSSAAYTPRIFMRFLDHLPTAAPDTCNLTDIR